MSAKFLLVTDLDNTLIGDHEATISLNQQLSLIRADFYLIYATGRSIVSVEQLGQEFQAMTGTSLLEPDYLVAGVGSEIYQRSSLDQTWAAHLSQDWQPEAIANLVATCPQFQPQSKAEQNPWKLSYYAKSDHNAAAVAKLSHQLAAAELAAQVVFSSDRDLDILPRNSGKGQAMKYLREKLQIQPQRTLVCGDSGNDIGLFEQQTLGVMVSNSQPELLNWHRSNPHPQHHRATSPYAWGILEALAHFKLHI
jgi:sucrose-6-phosphatase